MSFRTDLAVESAVRREIAGVTVSERVTDAFPVTTTRITTQRAAKTLEKPIGTYVTIEIDAYIHRDSGAFERGARLIAAELSKLLPADEAAPILVCGLGNRSITADAIGAAVIKNTMVTAHLVDELPTRFSVFRKAYALEAGVLGATGIESARLLAAVTREIRPAAVIVCDALAARSAARICRTVQICDTGIVPGSGVGNSRAAINRASLGVPVIAIGVPTVVDASALAFDILERAGVQESDFLAAAEYCGGLILTPREIDGAVNDISKLVGYGINLALHKGLDAADVTMFLG